MILLRKWTTLDVSDAEFSAGPGAEFSAFSGVFAEFSAAPDAEFSALRARRSPRIVPSSTPTSLAILRFEKPIERKYFTRWRRRLICFRLAIHLRLRSWWSR